MLREPTEPRYPRFNLPLWTAATVTVLLSACASIPPPTAAMTRAQDSIKAAQQAGAADADPVDLEFARGKFEQAQQAVAKGKNGPATDLAEESLADSRLALTKARLASMRAQVQAQQKENDRLRKQLLQREAKQRAAAEAASVQELPQTVMTIPSEATSTAAPATPASTSSANQAGGQ